MPTVAYAGGTSGHAHLTKARAALQPHKGTTRTQVKSTATPTTALAASTTGVAQPPAACGGAVSIAAGSSPGGYLPLSNYGYTPISGVGDDTVTLFSVPSFPYAGQSYNQLSVSSNGNVQVGGSGDATFVNQNLPDPTTPNNTLAALWTDLNPGAAGAVRIGTLTDGSDTWIVVDWASVPEFSLATRTHTFEIWIGVDGDANPGQDIAYAYGAQNGNGDGGFLTVGAENADGTSGGVTYFNGTGTLPANGTELRVSSTPHLAADFSATPSSGPAPLHVAFDATTSTAELGIQSYAWDFGDGTSGTGSTTSHDYAAGSYSATLTVTDSANNTCSAARQIDANGAFNVGDVSVNEGAGTATFTISRPSGPPASVDIAATAGSAKSPADFTAAPATLSFAAGETSKTYAVTIKQDALDEFNETYAVTLSNPVNGTVGDGTGKGTIVDDDPQVRISVNDKAAVEGDSGTTSLTFKVWLNAPSGKKVKVTVSTADGSANAPGDYTGKVTTISFSPGKTVKFVGVAIQGDVLTEANETFFVRLSNPDNVQLQDASAVGTILNDD